MEIRVIAFATASDILGKEPVSLNLAEGCHLSDLRLALIRRYPNLETIWERLAVAVDGQLVRDDPPLTEGCEVALLPPVSGGSGQRTALTDEPIDIAAVEQSVADPACGAVLLFLGNVRDHHAGRRVARLDYSAYRPMAEAALERIARELEAAGERLAVAIFHRLGQVPVGEASVVIAVASPHRQAAYEASREALERLKREVPIWKREHYDDGVVVWREEESLLASTVTP
ncbi:MAG: molybdenum cofactor biosynthesis protein MoaE [Acidobacteriota bacterium]